MCFARRWPITKNGNHQIKCFPQKLSFTIDNNLDETETKQPTWFQHDQKIKLKYKAH